MADESGGTTAYLGSSAPFVGRERELEVLTRELQQALTGTPALALIAGEPGIGKTRLTVELAATATGQGFQVEWGRCHEWEGAPAYWPWIQILRAVIAEIEPGDLPALLGSHAADIAQIVPELHGVLPELEPLPSIGPDLARFRLFDGVTSFLASAASRRPLMIVLEDLHWADTASLLLAQFLVREVRHARLLIAGTYRDVALGRRDPLAAVVADLLREPAARRIDLAGLPRDDVGRYVELAGTGDSQTELASAVYERTEGHPLFMVELVRLLGTQRDNLPAKLSERRHGSIPASVRHVISERVDRLPDVSRRALSVASVIGREFEIGALHAVSGLETDELADALDEALDARLIDESGHGRYRFSHALIQETIYLELGTTHRARLHSAVGEAIERAGTEAVDARLDDLAYHFLQAALLGDAQRAVTYAVRAAEHAAGRLAWEDAAGHYSRALELLEQRGEAASAQHIELLLALGDQLVYSGDGEAAKDAFRRAMSLAGTHGSPEQYARGALGLSGDLGGLIPFHAADREAIDKLLTALRLLPAGDSTVHVRVMSQVSMSPLNDLHSEEECIRLSDEAIAMAERLGDPAVLAYALACRWTLLWSDPARLRERISMHAEIRRLIHLGGNPVQQMFLEIGLAHDTLVVGNTQLAERHERTATRRIEVLGMNLPNYHVMCLRMTLALHHGQFKEAEEYAERAADIGRKRHREYGRVENERLSMLFWLRYLQGRLSTLDIEVRAFAEDHPGDIYWQAREVLHDAVHERIEKAAEQLADIMAGGASRVASGYAWYCNAVMLAEACAILDDTQHAPVLYQWLLPCADQNISEQTITYGPGSHYLGLLASLMEEWEDAERHFGDALAMNERMEAPPFLARTLVAWADMLVRRGDHPADRERAHALAQHAHATAVELGMARVAEQAKSLIDVRTAPPNNFTMHEHRLSPRELEVLRLVVEGKTDREIAESLFISHRTVMRHVTSILNKLGVSSRTAAATAAMRDGIV